jgi:hypothetical protein
MTILLTTRPDRVPLRDALGRHWAMRVTPLALFHLSALAIMLWSEIHLLAMTVFALTWGLVNFLWLALLRRPALAAALSLVLFVILIMVSRFKYDVLWMSLSFIDVMIIDADTFAFLMLVFPSVRTASIVAALAFIPIAIVIWRIDPFRVRRRAAAVGGIACLAGSAGLSVAYPVSPGAAFGNENYVSHFMRTGVDAVAAYVEQGFLESDPMTVAELRAEAPCESTGKRPHIILVHDESSFDIRSIEGVKVPSGYGQHFRSFDGKARKFLVEGAAAELVHRIQRSPGLSSRSTAAVLRDAYCGRPESSAACRGRATLRLPHSCDLSGERRLLGASSYKGRRYRKLRRWQGERQRGGPDGSTSMPLCA